MSSKITSIVMIVAFSIATAEKIAENFDRTVSDGVKSRGFKIVYGDEDMVVINQVVSDFEKNDMLKKRNRDDDPVKPLPANDVKCLMSVDKYCSKVMGAVKSILIQALKDDCAKCTEADKDAAGKVAAAMMTHDAVAWKTFLTRSVLLVLPPKKPVFVEDDSIKYRIVGKPEEILESRNRITLPGYKVRAKRYLLEPVS